MKKLYLLLIFLIFTIPQVKSQSTETFEALTTGSATFTSGGKTFNLSSVYGFVVASIASTGYDQTPKFIHVNDPSGAYGQAGAITAASGTFKINSFWFFVSGHSSYIPSATLGSGPGSITFIGKLSGSTVFTVVKNTIGADTGKALPGNGFTLVDFANEGGSDNTNQVIDQIEIHLSSNYDYFAIDNFTFTNIVAPTVTVHPSNKTICSGANTTFSVTALNTTGYQWQVNNGGGFTNITNNATYSGATSSTLSITGATSSMSGYQYRCIVTGSGSVNSNAATLTVPTALSSFVSANTPSDYGSSTGSATVTVSGGTTPYFYSWSPSGGTSNTTSGRAPGDYILTITDSTPNGLGGCSITQAVTILESPGASTNVNSLSGFTTCTGTASAFQGFIVNAAHLTSNLDLSTPSGYEISTTSDGPYFTNLSLTPTSGNINRTIYVRLAATATGTPAGNITISSTGITTKNVALSGTVNLLPAITAEPSSSTICAGANTTFSVATSNATGYKWQVDQGQGLGYTDISIGAPYSGVTSSTLTITGATAAMNGYLYRLVANNTCTSTATSNSATLIVNSAPAITAHPSSTSVCLGGNATFSVTATNATGYQWQVDQGAGFGPISNNAQFSGVTTSTLTITGATAELGGYAYRVVVTGGCNPIATSANVNLTIDSAPSITGQPSASSVCQGANTTFTATASNATGYQWQVDQGLGFTDISNNATYSGSTTSTLTITGATVAMSGYIYRAIASGTCTPTATSNSASLTVNSAPAITSNPSSVSICSGGTTTFSVTASNATAYKWQVDNGQGGGFIDVANSVPYSGITTSTLTITGAPAAFNGYKYRAVISGTCTPSAASSNATLTVNHITILTPKVDVACFGDATGQATATATGGTGSYTYSWSNGGDTATITGLIAGVYTVTVTDGNLCSNTASVTIGQPLAPLTLTQGTINNTSCYLGANGTATVIASGGTPSYSYSWNTNPVQTTATASGLSAGTYRVTVTDANGCTANRDFTISQPLALSITPSQTNVSCNGGTNGTATASVSGGTGAGTYTYSWAPTGGTAASATGLQSGTYTVTVTDANNCQITQSYDITQPPALTATQSQTEVLCNGSATGTATVTASGGSGNYSYSWSPSGGTAATATGLAANTYTCTITDNNGCFITKTFTISQPTAPLTATTSQINATCSTGGQAAVSPAGGAGGYTYFWSPGGQTTQIVTGLAAGSYNCEITDANQCSITKTFNISTTNTLFAIANQINILCNGANTGSAWVIPSGAPGPFTYVWSPSVSSSDTAANLSAGNYSVTITSANGCSIVKNFTITEPSAINITPSQTNVTCNGGSNGSASVTVTGGTGTYTYAWSPSGGTAATANGLSAGTYTVTVKDANSCTKTQSVTITEPDALIATPSQTDVSCKGGSNGSATVSVTGGTGTYSYQWSPSGGTNATASGLSAGTYTVLIKDSNLCETTASVTIIEPALLTATIDKTDVLCNQANNGTATVIPSGGTGTYTYSWLPSGGTAATATGLSPNTYSVTVTDANGCTVTETVQITEPTALSATNAQTNVSCNGGNNGTASVVASGGTGNYSYLWAPSGGTAATATGLTAGTYTVTVTDENACSVTNTIVITEPNALNLTSTLAEVSCYNGNNGSATVNVTGGTGSYSYSWFPSGGTTATATGLTAGTYTVTVTDDNSCTASLTVEILQPANPVTLNTAVISQVTVNGASLSGTASSNGINTDSGSCLTEVGFVYAQHANPTTADTKINISAALGTFTNSLSGLRGNRTYYVRTYAINSNGFVNYGNEVSFTTQKYTLTITAAAGHTKVYGTEDPVFNYTPLGFANGDTPSIITGLLSRDAGENVGKYNIKLGSISAGADYTIAFTGAEFEITKADQTITWDQTLEFGCIDSNNVALTATADSGLPISYTIASAALGTISGSTLNITGSGSSTITAVQNGDQNHNAATAVVKPIEVSHSGLVTQQWANVLFFDNKSNNYVAWQWYKNGVAVSGATRQYYSEVQPLNGSYYVIAKDKNGNSIKSCPIETTGTVFTKKIKIYPNPVKPGAEFTLECDFSDSQLNGSEVVIYDITGKLVQTISNVKAKNEIIAPSQAALYVVVLKLANGQLKTINLLVK